MTVDKKKCISCQACVALCPVGAIKIVKGKAEINKKICVGCQQCLFTCPQQAISKK